MKSKRDYEEKSLQRDFTLEIKQVKGYVKVAQNLENWVSWT